MSSSLRSLFILLILLLIGSSAVADDDLKLQFVVAYSTDINGALETGG